MYSVVSEGQRKYGHFCFLTRTQGTVFSRSHQNQEKSWRFACNSHVKQQALEKLQSSSCVLKPGSAFVKVHFCISEHTNPSACSNSLQLSLSQAGSWQQPSSSTVWSPMFSLIWVVKVRLLEAVYFTSPTKKVFFSPQTMTNPKTKKEGSTASNSC